MRTARSHAPKFVPDARPCLHCIALEAKPEYAHPSLQVFKMPLRQFAPEIGSEETFTGWRCTSCGRIWDQTRRIHGSSL
ncbi:MAG: hypothetical protein ABSF50_19330 [Burkholderiaceae bacterium]